jgi:uncharacterized coiled-coil protein SlyX
MAPNSESEIAVDAIATNDAAPRSSQRVRTPTAKNLETRAAQESNEDLITAGTKPLKRTSKATTTRGKQPGENNNADTVGAEMAGWRQVLEVVANLKEVIVQQQDTITDLHKCLKETQAELKIVHDQLDALTTNQTANTSPNPSYADVARTPPTSQPSNVRTVSTFNTIPSNATNTLYCTIDTSRVGNDAGDQVSAGAMRTIVEGGIRAEQDNSSWRCQAVTVDPRNPHRIRIACRDETEHNTVKRVVEANLIQGVRILRNDLYPIRVDSVKRTAVLDEGGNVRTEAAEALGKENDTQIAKVGWLSNRGVPKAYGSMVVYLSKRSEAQRFLNERFFYAGGESGYTKAFERRERPKQCYNCQEITGHKAYQCDKPKVCGRCAKAGHHHGECTEAILKCIPCGGPHESFSRNCRMLYPSQHE